MSHIYPREMAFRKRNVGLGSTNDRIAHSTGPSSQVNEHAPVILQGVRPSPLDGRLITSTGTQSLDDILAGHSGLALGNSLLIEENGTTDFASALLRYHAAEGIVQGHCVHVVGVGEQWGSNLPGVVGRSSIGAEEDNTGAVDKEKMKIAWRYERLGDFGVGLRGGISPSSSSIITHIDRCCPLLVMCAFLSVLILRGQFLRPQIVVPRCLTLLLQHHPRQRHSVTALT